MKTKITTQPATLAVDNNTDTRYAFGSASLSAEQLDEVISTINQVKSLLPSMPDLTPLERQRISKLGARTRGFADAALEAATHDIASQRRPGWSGAAAGRGRFQARLSWPVTW
jgi:hypothetical protein